MAGDEIEIQAALETAKCFELEPNRDYYLDWPLLLKAGQTLSGKGYNSVLNYRGEGTVAVYFGELELSRSNYGCYMKDLAVRGGGVQVRKQGQHCGIDKVWVIDAPGAGFEILSGGDRMLLRDCVAWNCGIGFHIRASQTINGMILEHCNAQGCDGPGLIAETIDNFHAGIADLQVRDFTCQGNNRTTLNGAEIILRGSVSESHFQHLWVECVVSKTAVRCESKSFPNTNGVRSPRNLYIEQGSRFSAPSDRSSLELLAGDGVVVRESRLTVPIRRAVNVAEPLQSGPHSVPVEVLP